MKTFAELCDYRPSVALRAMLDGLHAAEQREDFIIDMGTYGGSKKGICFGCAATCTVMELTSTQIQPYLIADIEGRSVALNADSEDLDYFEGAINYARKGCLYPLFEYLEISEEYQEDYDCQFNLGTSDWREQIPGVEQLIYQLEDQNL